MIKFNKNKILTFFVFLIILSLIPSAYAMENAADSQDYGSSVGNNSQIAVENDNNVLNSPGDNVIYVDASSGDDSGFGAVDSPFKTIQKGLSAVGTNGTLYLNGEFKGVSNTNLEIKNANLLITSEKGATIDGDKVARIFSVSNSTLVLNNLNFVNGFSSTNGGAIYMSDATSSLAISNSVFENNSVTATLTSAGFGGAIYSKGFITFKDNVIFKNNSASYRGGAVYADSGFNITGNNFYALGNYLPKSDFGSFIYSAKDSYISGKNMLFAKNYAKSSSSLGGAIYAKSLLSVGGENITFKDNYAINGAGAIYAGQLILAVNDLTFDNNSAKLGGAIKTSSAKVLNITGNNILFANNKAIGWGGAISAYNVCYIKGENITFVNNSVSGNTISDPGYGGAISCNNPKLTTQYHKTILDGVTFINNTANSGAAVIGYTVDIKNSSFINNLANVNGGAVYVLNTHLSSQNTIANSVFINNKADVASDVYLNKEGYTTLDNNWWGDNNPNWTARVNQAIVPASYAVLNLTANPSAVGAGESASIIANFYANNTTTNLNIHARNIKLSSTGGSIVATGDIVNGKFTTEFTADTKGTYTITGSVDGVSQSVDVVVGESSPNTKIYVNYNGGDDSNNGKSWNNAVKTINKALSLVDDNGIIYIANGNYISSSTVLLNKNVAIIGQNQSVLDANKKVLFNVANGYTVSLTNLTMVNAYSSNFGGIIVNNGELTISNSVIANNTAYGAGAIDNGGILTVIGSYFYNNQATGHDSGAISNMGTATIINSTFDSNKAFRNGGVIKNQNSKSLTVSGSTFINNAASGSNKGSYGGAIYNWAVGLEVHNSTFVNNSASDKGGAIYISYGNTALTPSFVGSNLVFVANSAKLGDAIFTEASNVNVSNSAFINHEDAVYRSTTPDRGTIDLNSNWWGTNNSGWDKTLVNIAAPKVYAVLDVTANKVSAKSYDVIANMYWNGTAANAVIPVRNISFTSGSQIINGTIADKPVKNNYQFDNPGKYIVNVKVDNESKDVEIIINDLSNSIYVNSTGGDDSNNGSSWNNAVKTLTQALTLVKNNGIIYVANGNYISDSTITFAKNVSVIGQDSQKTIFDGNKKTLFNIGKEYTISLSNLTITNCYSSGFGGAIVTKGKLTISNSVIANNTARGAGAIDNVGNLTVENSIFYNNKANGHDAGAISSYYDNGLSGIATITNSKFINNSAFRNGGAIKNQGDSITLIGCEFTDNAASGSNKGSYGGAVYSWISSLKVSDSIFVNNSASDKGGAIYSSAGNAGDKNTLNASNCVFINNSAKDGSAIFNEKTVSDVTNSVFINNSKGAVRSDIPMNINDNWWGNSTPNWDDLLVVPDRRAGPGIPISYVVLDVSHAKNDNSYDVIANLYLNGTKTKADIPLRDIELVYNSESIKGQLVNSTFKANYPFTEPGIYTVLAIVDNDIQKVSIVIKEVVLLDDVYVNATGGNDFNNGSDWNNAVKTLKKAFAIVKNNGIIHIANGVLYNDETINVDKNVAIVGQSQDKTIINGNGTSLFGIDNQISVDIANLTITNCQGENDNFGGAMSNKGTLTVTNVSFIANSAKGAGAIDNSGKLTVISCYFANNKATGHDAGAISNFGSLNVVNSVFINNTAFRNAGAIKNQESKLFTITGSSFIGNFASGSKKGSYGGAVYSWMASMIIKDSEFINNSAIDKAGAIYISGGNNGDLVTLKATGLTFINNTGKLGGAIYTESANSKIEYNVFVNNSPNTVYNNTGFKGEVSVNNNWWGNNTPDWATLLYNIDVPEKFAVLNIIAEMSGNDSKIIAKLYWNGTNSQKNIGNISARTINLSVADAILNPSSGIFENGVFTSIFKADKAGNYTVTAVVDNEVQSMNMSVVDKSVVLTVPNVVKYYMGNESLVANLVDAEGNPVVGVNVTFTINGKNYTKVTDKYGNASMGIKLVPGFYNVTTTYGNMSVRSNITVMSTIVGDNLVKMFQNDTHFFAKFLDSNGNPLANTTVRFNINGVFYNATTNASGVAKLGIKLYAKEYILTAYNPVTGEEKGFNVTVKPLITQNNDLVKYYRNASQFSVKVYNKDGSLANGTNVTFNINGVFYHKQIINGTATLNINLRPGKYVITSMYEGYAVGNNITVLPTLITKDLDMKYLDGSNFTAQTLDGQGKPLANQNISFNVHGVFYHRTTDENGIASLNMRLNPGKYIITSIWNEYQVGNNITIA